MDAEIPYEEKLHNDCAKTLSNFDLRIAQAQARKASGKPLSKKQIALLASADEMPMEEAVKIVGDIARHGRRGAASRLAATKYLMQMQGHTPENEVQHEHTHSVDMDAIRGLITEADRANEDAQSMGVRPGEVLPRSIEHDVVEEAEGHRERSEPEPDGDQ